jgi:hypothetical protein
MSDAHDERKARVRLEILKSLNRVSGYLLPENILHAELNLRVRPTVLLSEFRGELAELEPMGLITIISPNLGGTRQVRLTDAGRAEVAANL